MTPSALHSGSRETEPLFIARSHHRNTLWLQEHYYASMLLSLSLLRRSSSRWRLWSFVASSLPSHVVTASPAFPMDVRCLYAT